MYSHHFRQQLADKLQSQKNCATRPLDQSLKLTVRQRLLAALIANDFDRCAAGTLAFQQKLILGNLSLSAYKDFEPEFNAVIEAYAAHLRHIYLQVKTVLMHECASNEYEVPLEVLLVKLQDVLLRYLADYPLDLSIS